MTPHEVASYWFVRQDAQGMTAEDRQEFECWLAASATHRSIYQQTRSMWAGFEAAAEDNELRALRVSALAAGPAPNVWPRAAAIAATLVLGIFAVAALTWKFSNDVDTAQVAASQTTGGQYVTAQNQRSTVTLPDGSLVSMNLDTVFTTDFTHNRRLIELAKGQAFFDVAKDQTRPFIVKAAGRDIQALGTKFDVKLEQDRVEVVLLEGRVSVGRSAPSLLKKVMGRASRVELKPDQRLIAQAGEAPSITATNAMQATSWREGWIVFEDETVEHAIGELNRYSDRPLIAAPDVRQMRLSGVFRIGQPDRFGAVIQELLPLEVERGANGETLLVRKPGTAGRYP